MIEWGAGFAMGLCIGALPTAFAMGAMHQQSLSARTKAELVRELHKAAVDIGSRFSTWMKGKKDETKLGAAFDADHGACGAGIRSVMADARKESGAGIKAGIGRTDARPARGAGTQGKNAKTRKKAVE